MPELTEANLFAGPWPWVILIVVLLLFGAPKLPALARSMGQSMKIFRNEIKSDKDEAKPDASVAENVASDAPRAETDKPGS